MIMVMVYKVRDNDWMIGWSNMSTVQRVRDEYNGISVSTLKGKHEWGKRRYWKRMIHKERILRGLKWSEEHERD